MQFRQGSKAHKIRQALFASPFLSFRKSTHKDKEDKAAKAAFAGVGATLVITSLLVAVAATSLSADNQLTSHPADGNFEFTVSDGTTSGTPQSNSSTPPPTPVAPANNQRNGAAAPRVTINGENIAVPVNGSIEKTITTSDGTVNVSVQSSSKASSSFSSRVRIDSSSSGTEASSKVHKETYFDND